MQTILNHFKKRDSKLYSLLVKIEPLEEIQAQDPKNYFLNLCRSIISQQLSIKVAAVIFERFKNLFPDGQPTPEAVLKISDQKIRKIGFSKMKINYIKDLSQKIVDKKINLTKLQSRENEQVIEELTEVKGIGVWTAEMFLMFSLGRSDIFSHGDLGLRNAIKKIYELDNPSREEIMGITLKWSPYRTYACRILWRSLSL